jgi:hypothetical protein
MLCERVSAKAFWKISFQPLKIPLKHKYGYLLSIVHPHVSESASVPGNSSSDSSTTSSGDKDTNQSVNNEDNIHKDNTDYAFHEYSSEYNIQPCCGELLSS